MSNNKNYMTIDGNTAASHVSYAFTEFSAIYPITPSSTMGELIDAWSSQGRKNLWGNEVKVVEMQSEGGAAAAVHGALQAGTLSTSFTASQGLLLMLPNLYKWVGELLPGVLHIAARSIANRSLSIFGDHNDIYAARPTGVAMISSHSVQESMDLAGVAHLSAIKASYPFIHFFDGFRTSHEIQKVEEIDLEALKGLIDQEALEKFRASALNPHTNPVTRGGAENDDISFQGQEAANLHAANVITVVDDYMKEISKLTGRHYAPFVYYGHPEADRVLVAMGSVTQAIEEVVDAMNENGEKVGLIKVHLYRPFSIEHIKAVVPASVKKIAVLDRTKEQGASEPLYLDVHHALSNHNDIELIIGGRYGLSSKDTQPNELKAVYDHLNAENPFDGFTISIIDDVTHKSLKADENFEVKRTSSGAIFFGLGSDGTVSANKSSIKIIGDHTDLYSQAYFAYDSRKAGGATRSFLRFGPEPIKSTYYVKDADFISCSLDSYLVRYNMLDGLKKGGTFLLNTTFTEDEITDRLPNRVKKQLADRDAKMYIIDATEIAEEIGMGRHTNTILQSSFFALNPQIIPYEDALTYMKDMATQTYGSKGQDIVELNHLAIDKGKDGLIEIPVDPAWKELSTGRVMAATGDSYYDDFVNPINALEGYDVPTSVFLNEGILDGSFHNNSAFNEHRAIATNVPVWYPENCIQCGFCSFVCPHSTIRTFLLDENEVKNAPMEFETLKPVGKGVDHLYYRVQVSPDNCVGCGLCSVECPGKAGKKALVMKDIHESLEFAPLANYIFKETRYKSEFFPTDSIKGSQFLMPYFENSGACAGCGETPYYRLASQLFGRDMLIANATGCSSIYCGSTPSSPFVKDKQGEGIAWANSLFEDNAEYGFGMKAAQEFKSASILTIAEKLQKEEATAADLKEKLAEYVGVKGNRDQEREVVGDLVTLLKNSDSPMAQELLAYERDLVSKSVWIIGGDGWAYDIGFGGLDHVIANNLDVNILILDTEVYSNTGGQASKASPTAAIAKFAASGKETAKKDIGMIAMTYGHVYVASISMGANRVQTIKALKEAEAYNGPSLVIAYSPCIEHGIKGGLSNHQIQQKMAVESGYWTLFRYNPDNEEKPLTIDSRKPDFTKYKDFVLTNRRYNQLESVNPEHADALLTRSAKEAERRYRQLVKFSQPFVD
ncbi:MAG TPA: pyruvate:ferredoxin (flavodoxin) oxidoreductase [Erysipelothrix sp.]|nr:pyruvate:ferredoxin (flavodoxin) oxidoreductase [Erysipelothrix sp.]